jgi:hypothetical protein
MLMMRHRSLAVELAAEPKLQCNIELVVISYDILISLNERSPDHTAVELTAELNLSDEAPSSNNSSFCPVNPH